MGTSEGAPLRRIAHRRSASELQETSPQPPSMRCEIIASMRCCSKVCTT